MTFWETIRVALTSLRTNKLRSFLTILGIVIGIFSIISTSTVISMLQAAIDEGLSFLNKNTFQIQKYPAMQMGHWDDRYHNRKNITIDEYNKLKKVLEEAQTIGAEQHRYGRLVKSRWKKTNPNVSVNGITPEMFQNYDWTVNQGRALNQNDVDLSQKVCVLGADVAEKLFHSINPLGQEIKFDGLRLTVVGVMNAQGQIFGESRDNFVVCPLTTFQNEYGKYSRSVIITVMARSPLLYDRTIEAAIGHLRAIRKVPPGSENDFEIFSNESLIKQIGDITKYVRGGAIVVALIALLAAGVGIMNIMLVSVTERTREIGIRKAIGAKKRNILAQFLIEAVTLCQVGGIIGIVLGLLAGNIAGTFLKAPSVLPLDWIIIGVGLCVAVGVGFGTYPAYKAASLDPIEALRYE